MTEPQKMGIQEVMGLAITFASARYYSVGAQGNEPRERLREALTAIIADRDALALRVKELEEEIQRVFDCATAFCPFCGDEPCKPDCIIRTLTKEPQ